MAFLTQEQVRAVRLKGSEKVSFERGLEVVVTHVSASKALEIRKRQLDTDTPEGQRALFLFMLQAACAAPNGELFTVEDAELLLDLLSLDEVTDLINKISANLSSQGKAAASRASVKANETSSSASASPSAGPTPTT